MVSFAVQKLVSMIKSIFFYFCFYFYYTGRPNKTFVWLMSENVLLMFSPRSLMVSFVLELFNYFFFRATGCVLISLIYKELSSFSQHCFLKRLSFFHFVFLPLLSKFYHRCLGLFLGSVFHMFVCLFLYLYHTVLILAVF